MRITATESKANTAARRRFRPADPVWASARDVSAARTAVKRVDSRLDIWWHNGRQTWRVVEWLPRTGMWSTTFYWEGVGHSYRPITAIDAIVYRLRKCDWSCWKHRNDEWTVDKIDAQMSAKSKRVKIARDDVARELSLEYGRSLENKMFKKKITFGPGTGVTPGDHKAHRELHNLTGGQVLKDELRKALDAND